MCRLRDDDDDDDDDDDAHEMKMKPAVTHKEKKKRESETHLRPNVVLHRSSSVVVVVVVVVVVSTARKTNFVPMKRTRQNRRKFERERQSPTRTQKKNEFLKQMTKASEKSAKKKDFFSLAVSKSKAETSAFFFGRGEEGTKKRRLCRLWQRHLSSQSCVFLGLIRDPTTIRKITRRAFYVEETSRAPRGAK